MSATAPANFTIYKNGNYFASGAGYVGGSSTDTGVQTVIFSASGFSYDGSVYYSGNKAVSITAGSAPTLSGPSVSPTPIYPGASFTASASFNDSDGDLNSYGVRYQGYGLIGSGSAGAPPVWSRSLSAGSSAPGTAGATVNVRAEVWDNYGHGVTGSWVTYTVQPRPTTFTFSVSQNHTFTYDGGTKSISVSSTNPSGATYTTSGTYSASAPGTYTASATAYGNYTGNGSRTWHIAKGAGGSAGISPASQTVAVGTPITFNASGGNSSGSYVWGGDASGTGPSKTVTFNTQGTRSVTVYRQADAYYNNSSTATATITVKLNQSAVSISPVSPTIAVGDFVTFTASGGSGSGNYVWGGDASGTGSSKTVTFNTAGTRTVTVYRQGNSTYLDSNTAIATITVKINQPTVSISPTSQTINAGQTLAFTASGGAGSGAYVWGGDASGTGSPKNVTFSTTGTRYVTVYRQGNSTYNDSNTATATITVNAAPDTQAPTIPGGLNAPNSAATSFTLNWTASTDNIGVAAYEVRRDTTSLGEVPGTSASVAGLASGVTYSMTVRARDAATPTNNWSAWSSPFLVTTAPTSTAATNIAGTSFTANWNAATGVTGYRLDVSTSSTFTTFVGSYNNLSVGNVTSYSVTGLTAGTVYYYRVRAVNTSSTSGNSNVVTAGAIPLEIHRPQ